MRAGIPTVKLTGACVLYANRMVTPCSGASHTWLPPGRALKTAAPMRAVLAISTTSSAYYKPMPVNVGVAAKGSPFGAGLNALHD